MTCKQCETLLEHYSESVRLYSQVSHSLRGIVGEDFTKGVEEAEKLRRDGIQLTTFMIATDEALVDFVDTMTKIARGRAYYASPTDLATFVFRDYIRNRKKLFK